MELDLPVEQYRENALKILDRRFKVYVGFCIFLFFFCVIGPAFIIIDNLRRDSNQWSDILFFIFPALYAIPIGIQFPRLLKVRKQVRESNNIITIRADFKWAQVGTTRYFIFNNSGFGFKSVLANPSRWYNPKLQDAYDCVIFADSSFTGFESPAHIWESMPLYIPENRLVYKLSNETKDFTSESN